MRFFKIILTVGLSLVALFSVLCLAAVASEGKKEAFYYIFFTLTGMGSFFGAYFLVKNIRKNKCSATQNYSCAAISNCASSRKISSNSQSIVEKPLEGDIDSPICSGKKSTVEYIAGIISCENGETISLNIVAQKISMPPDAIGEYVTSILFDVLSEVTARDSILSEKQEKAFREFAAVCGATLSQDVESQLEKLATIRDIVSFKADPREFVRKSLLVA